LNSSHRQFKGLSQSKFPGVPVKKPLNVMEGQSEREGVTKEATTEANRDDDATETGNGESATEMKRRREGR